MSEEGKSATNRRLSDTKFALDAARKIAIIRRAWTMQEWTHTHQLQQAVAELGSTTTNMPLPAVESIPLPHENMSRSGQAAALPGLATSMATLAAPPTEKQTSTKASGASESLTAGASSTTRSIDSETLPVATQGRVPTLDDFSHKDKGKVTAEHNDNEQVHGTTNIKGGKKDKGKGKGKMSRAIYPKGKGRGKKGPYVFNMSY